MDAASRTPLSALAASGTMRAYRMSNARTGFSEVYTVHKHAIYTFVLLRVGRNRDVAEDIVSDVFLKAYRNYDSYDERYAVTTWLYTITRNTLIDYYRTRRDTVDIDDLPVADVDDPLYRLLTENISESEVHAAIAQLPETQRALITSQFFDGKTSLEIAEEHGMSHAAVRKHVSRGLSALRGALLSCVAYIQSLI